MTAPLIAHDYASLMAALVARKRELGFSNLDVDEAAGLGSGYFGKLVCGTRGLGSVSLGSVLEGLSVAIVLTPKKNLFGGAERISPYRGKRGKPRMKKFSLLGSRGAQARNVKLGPSAVAAHMAKMRAAKAKRAKPRLPKPAAAAGHPEA